MASVCRLLTGTAPIGTLRLLTSPGARVYGRKRILGPTAYYLSHCSRPQSAFARSFGRLRLPSPGSQCQRLFASSAARFGVQKKNALSFSKPFKGAPPRCIERTLEGGAGIQVMLRERFFYEEYLKRKLEEYNTYIAERNLIPYAWVTGLLEASHMCKNLEQSQAMMLLYLSSLAREVSPQTRLALTKNIWKALNRNDLNLSITPMIFNTYLDVVLQNGGRLNEKAVLKTMEKESIVPDSMTYQLLIKNHCNYGDMESASRILSYMKSRGFEMDVSAFDSLIMGHMKNKDFKSAEDIVNSMSQTNLKLTRNTYDTMMKGLAQNGRVDDMLEKLSDAKDAGQFTGNSTVFDLILILAKEKNPQAVDLLFPHLNTFDHLFWKDLTRSVMDLISNGCIDSAVYLRRAVLPLDKGSKGSAIIRSLALCNHPIEQIMSIHQELHPHEASSIESFVPALISGGVIFQERPAYSLEVFKYLDSIANDVTWNAMLIQKILEAAELENSKQDILAVWNRVFSSNVSEAITTENLLTHLVKPLKSMKVRDEEILSFLEEKSQGLARNQMPWMKLFLCFGRLKLPSLSSAEIELMAADCSHDAALGEMLAGIAVQRNQTFAIEACVFLHTLKKETSAVLTQSIMLHRCLHNCQWTARDFSMVEGLMKAFSTQDLKLSIPHQSMISQQLKEADVWYPFEKLLQEIPLHSSPGTELNFSAPISFPSLSIDALEALRGHQLQTSDRQLILTALMHKHAMNGGVEKSVAILDELDKGLAHCSRICLSQMALFAVDVLHDVERSDKYLSALMESNPWDISHLTIVLYQAEQLCKEGNHQDAIQRLQSFRNRHKSKILLNSVVYGGLLQKNTSIDGFVKSMVSILLSRYSHRAAVDIVRSMWQMNFISDSAFVRIGTKLVRDLLQYGDLDPALDLYRACTASDKAASCVQLYVALWKAGRHAEFESLTANLSDRMPESEAQLRIALSYLLCGEQVKARSVFQSISSQIDTSAVSDAAGILEVVGNAEAIKHFYNWIKDLPVSSQKISTALIKTLISHEDAQSLSDIMKTNEHLKAAQQLKGSIISLLTREQITIPNSLQTQASNENENKRSAPKASLTKDMNYGLLETELNRAFEKDHMQYFNIILASAKAADFQVSDVFVAKVIGQGLSEKPVHVVRKWLWALASEQHFSILQSAAALQKRTNISMLINSVLLSAYLKQGKHEDILKMFKKDPNFLVRQLSTKYMAVLPMDQMNSLLCSMHESGHDVLHKLISFHICNDDFSSAQVLLTKYPELRNSLQVLGIFNSSPEHVANLKHTDTIEQTVDYFVGSDLQQAVFSEAIFKLCQFNQADRAQSIYDQALSSGLSEEHLRGPSSALSDLINNANLKRHTTDL